MNPTSSKRRMRREPITNSEIPDSSPSQPAKRRRKLDIPVKTEPEPIPEPENAAPLPIDQAGIGKTDDDLVTAVTNYLEVPPHPVKAIDDNSNCTHEAYGAEVQAYAKLSGNGWTFYIKMLVNVIGRPSEVGDRRDEQPKGIEVGALPKAPQDDRGVHLNLGPNKMVSRNHAEISYDSQSEKWKIHVNGRNGIKHNGNRLNRSQEKLLSSGDVIEVGGCEMMFIMPRDNEPLVIHKMYLRRAHLIRTDDSEITEDEDIEPQSATLGSSAIRGEKGTAKGTPIAPAPPDYKRPGTPDSSRPRINYTMGKSPYAGGTIVMNAEDVDLSKDDNRHIKPTFSYAQLITQAVLSGPNKRQTLANIYKYITDSFAYYRHQTPSGWQNSIRHNLSLHKAFDKTARSPDDPGKGMLWYIKGEHYDEMVNSAFSRGRGGHRGSPGSPSVRTPGENSSVAKPRSKRSNSAASQTVSQYPSDAPQYTPDRAAGSLQDDVPGDGSPLPRHRRHGGTTYGLSNTPGSPPVLPSSYAPEEGSSFVTPAPHRVIPHLAPPSTAQRPSQHMPTSSPAPFWKYAEFHATPSRGLATFDLSPEKGLPAGPSLPLSSSPAPIRRSSAVSPSRAGTSAPKYDIPEDLEEEDKGFDLTKGFQSIGSYHAPAPRPSMSLELKPFPAHS